jgi:mycothiol synthase
VIRLEWRPSLVAHEAAEVATLLGTAAAYDEEAGFSTASPGSDGRQEWHLLVRMGPRGSRGREGLEHLPDEALVAYLELGSDEAEYVQAQLVVHPDLRSLGVATLTAERILGNDGWPAGTDGDVHVWSHGSHPAAERMSRRFGAVLAAAAAKTVCFLPELQHVNDATAYRQQPATGADVLPGHRSGAAPAERACLERAGVAHLDPDDGGVVVALDGNGPASLRVLRTSGQTRDDLTRLLLRGGRVARDQGARVAVLYLDATDEVLVQAALSVGFVHEHSDVLFVLPRTG